MDNANKIPDRTKAMIKLDLPLDSRDPIELLELLFYQLRMERDSLVRAIEKTQAAAVSLGPGSLNLVNAGLSLLEAHSGLGSMFTNLTKTLNGLGSYLKLHEVELFESMKELLEAQDVIDLVESE